MQAGCDVEKSHTRPLGQAASQQQPSSSAGAAHSSSSEPAPTSRTPIEKDLEEAVLHVPNKLVNSEDQAHQLASCSKMWIVCSPACILTSTTSTSMSSELDWATHITIHEREVLDAQAPAPASSCLGDHDRHPHIPPHWCSSKQMASKLSTGSSSNTAVGERTARGPHAPRSSTRARIAATSDASDATNGMAGASGWGG